MVRRSHENLPCRRQKKILLNWLKLAIGLGGSRRSFFWSGGGTKYQFSVPTLGRGPPVIKRVKRNVWVKDVPGSVCSMQMENMKICWAKIEKAKTV